MCLCHNSRSLINDAIYKKSFLYYCVESNYLLTVSQMSGNKNKHECFPQKISEKN